MKFIVSLRQVTDRPSGHKLNPSFVKGGLNYNEDFCCPHAEEHAKLFIKFFDLSALKCGLDTGEFKTDKEVQAMIGKVPDLLAQIERIISEVNTLHAQVYPPKLETPRFSLKTWRHK
jgi:hypothetical protein